MFTAPLNVIKSGNKSVSFRHRDAHYVIGFPKPLMARYVLHVMHPEPEIRMSRSTYDDISGDINSVVGDLAVGKTTIDCSATLRIPKGHQSHESTFYIEPVAETQFLMWPFRKRLGIVMPYEIVDEDDAWIVMRSHVVDPSDSFSMFRIDGFS